MTFAIVELCIGRNIFHRFHGCLFILTQNQNLIGVSCKRAASGADKHYRQHCNDMARNSKVLLKYVISIKRLKVRFLLELGLRPRDRDKFKNVLNYIIIKSCCDNGHWRLYLRERIFTIVLSVLNINKLIFSGAKNFSFV